MDQSMKEAWQNWQKMQENTIKFWKDLVVKQSSEMAENVSGQAKNTWQEWWKYFLPDNQAEKMPAMFDGAGFPDSVKRFYQDWYKMTSSIIGDYIKSASSPTGREAFGKVMQSVNLYTRLLTFWSDMVAQMPAEGELARWQETSEKWVQEYSKVLESFFMIFFPEQLKGLITAPTENLAYYQQFFLKLLQPWTEGSEKLQKNLLLALKGDKEAYLEFLKGFNHAFQESVEKNFNLPNLGLNKENMDKLVSSMEAYTGYVGSLNELVSLLYKLGYEGLESLMQKMGQLIAEGESPESFRELYQVWWKTNEETYLEFFKTENFARMLNKTVESWARFKERSDSLLSDLLSYLPIPNRSEMDSLEKTVYQLKRLVRDQGKRIEELSRGLQEQKSIREVE